MKKNICYQLICVVTLAFLLSGCANPATQPTPTQTQEPSSTSIPPSNTPEITDTTAPTLTPEPTATMTSTPLPAATNTPYRTATKQAESTQAAEVVIGEIMEELAAVGLSSENGYLLWAQEEPLEL